MCKGVTFMLNQEMEKTIKEYWPLSDRFLLLKIVGKPLDLNINQIYSPIDIEKIWSKQRCNSDSMTALFYLSPFYHKHKMEHPNW